VSEKLKLCPFCGRKPEIKVEYYAQRGMPPYKYYVWCKCGNINRKNKSKNIVIAAWNKRMEVKQ